MRGVLLIAKTLTPEDMVGSNLRQAIEAQRFAIAEQDAMMFFDADERMHALFCHLAGQAPVWDVIADAKQHMDRVRRISLDDMDLDTLLIDHVELYRCVEAGDGGGARKVLRRHLRRVLVDLERLGKRFPDYFERTAEAPLAVARNPGGGNR